MMFNRHHIPASTLDRRLQLALNIILATGLVSALVVIVVELTK